jgi:Flp pilus assembly secretin CpaC
LRSTDKFTAFAYSPHKACHPQHKKITSFKELILTKPKNRQAMKKTCLALLTGITSILAAQAQTNAQQTATDVVTNTTNAVSVAATVTTNTSADTATTNAPASSPDNNANAPATSEPAATGIPQIKFSDVPITTAIENLARLANINYMLDPKIGYGQPDASGQIKPEPVLSIRWENISAENALLALLDNYGLQLVHDKQTGISRITLKDPTAPPPLFTKVIQLKYAGVSNILDAAQSVLTDKRSKVMSDPRTSQIIVVATDPEQQAVDTLMTQLDKPTRQVLIETRLIQVSSTPQTQKGVDWSGTLQNQHVTFGNGNSQGTFTTTFPGTGTDPAGQPTTTSYNTVGSVVNSVGGGGFSWNTKSGTTPDIGFLNADGLSAVLSYLNSSSEAQVMSTPRVVTLDNEQAKIEVTRTYPIFTTTAGTANTAGGSSVNYSNVGTILFVTPRISANDYIWLKVLPTVSSFAGNFTQSVPNTGTSGGASIVSAPTFDVRTIATQVLIPNANTLVMGGLVQDNPTASYTKVPLLGDVPGLGFFFRSENKQEDKENLLIFITPTIVRDTDFQATTSLDFLKSKPTPMKEPMNAGSAWDSAQPAGQWSDPVPRTAQ